MGVYEIEEAVETTPSRLLKQWRAELLVSGLPLNAHTNAYADALLVKSGPGVLFGFSGYSSNVAGQFIQVHDSATVPADGAVPVMVISLGTAASNFSAYFALPGRTFLYGIVLCNSSTAPTKTVGSADTWFDAQFI